MAAEGRKEVSVGNRRRILAILGLLLLALSCQRPGGTITTKVAGPGEADYVNGTGGRR